MAIVGIGTDIVTKQRIAKLWNKFGVKFATKILSLSEMTYFKVNNDPVSFLAKRFAAKEAFVKARGRGFCKGCLVTDIEIKHDSYGKPYITLPSVNLPQVHLTISDEKEFAIAFVVIETT